jgi:hypothetical protein
MNRLGYSGKLVAQAINLRSSMNKISSVLVVTPNCDPSHWSSTNAIAAFRTAIEYEYRCTEYRFAEYEYEYDVIRYEARTFFYGSA